MPTVATGIPGGICTMLCRASTPLSGPPAQGKPMTGRIVCPASTPGRAAARPATPMRTWRPRPAASRAYFAVAFGVRCAERMLYSHVMPNWSSTAVILSTVSWSDLLPATIPTFAFGTSLICIFNSFFIYPSWRDGRDPSCRCPCGRTCLRTGPFRRRRKRCRERPGAFRHGPPRQTRGHRS